MSTDRTIYGDTLYVRDGCIRLTYSSEADLRDNLAQYARHHGWIAETEVSADRWGRIDLVLDAGTTRGQIVEIKLELQTARQIRAGIQQIDRYSRWWDENRRIDGVPFWEGRPTAWLVAPTGKINQALADEMVGLYPGIRIVTVSGLMSHIGSRCPDAATSLGRLLRERKMAEVAFRTIQRRSARQTIDKVRRLGLDEMGLECWRDLNRRGAVA